MKFYSNSVSTDCYIIFTKVRLFFTGSVGLLCFKAMCLPFFC